MALVLSWPRFAAALPLMFALALWGHFGAASAQEVYGDYAPGYSAPMGQNRSPELGFGGGWIGVEYLRWRLDGGSDLPPLVTDGPATEPLDEVGRLDNPTTDILFGDETVGDDWRSGYRIYGGIWLDCCQCWGINADYFELDDDDDNFTSESDPDRIVTRPFFNAETGEDDIELVDVPNELEGTVEVSAGDDFSGGGLAVQRRMWQCCDPCGYGPSAQVYMLGGYRHYEYDSDLVITENLLVTGVNLMIQPGTAFFVQDRFSTHNEFDGAEIGFQGLIQQSIWWLDGLFKVAVGSHRRAVKIDGETIIDNPGGPTDEYVGGLLTSEVTNIGRYTDDTIAVIPEFRLGVGAQLTNNVSVRAGYNLILWNAVARAGSQLPPGLEVDRRNLPPIDPTMPGGPEPEFAGILGTTLVAHGLDLGVQFTY